MKELFYFVLFFTSFSCFAQPYTPMPADSAIWRYRIYDIDFITQVLDNILFLNGQDTSANGNIYHKIISRTCRQVGSAGFDPPIVTTEASSSDIFYGGMREAGKQVYFLTSAGFLVSGTPEKLIYDFNVGVGDSIPAYVGRKQVVATDSILIGGVYHKRFLTTDTAYYVIEGVGSNRGLIPDLNDGGGTVVFYCFTDTGVTWSPDTTFPCTYIYPMGFTNAISNVNNEAPEINVYPIPANDILHIATTAHDILHVAVFNSTGQYIWSDKVTERTDIPVTAWPKGVYYMEVTNEIIGKVIKKIVIE